MTDDDDLDQRAKMALIGPGASEEVAALVAENLRGSPSPLFLRLLAMCFDPPQGKKPPRRAFFKRSSGGRPRGARVTTDRAGKLMADAIDDSGKTTDDAFADATNATGARRSTAFEGLQREREFRALAAMVKPKKKTP